MVFVGPSDERWTKPATANGGPVAAQSVIFLWCCWTFVSVGGGSWLQWFLMVLVAVKMEREREVSERT
jgi:hypothetical protein